MNRIDLNKLDDEKSFKVKMEVYLYKDAVTMLERGKGDKKKLRGYMERRLEIIEELLRITRPFRINEGKEELVEVRE